MKSVEQPHSIVSPVTIVYVPPSDEHAREPEVLSHAAGLIPAARMFRKRKVGRKTESYEVSREVVAYKGAGGQSRVLARLEDRVPEAPAWLWEVGVLSYREPESLLSVRPGSRLVVLDVARFKTSQGAVRGAAQLALLRHLFVEGLRAIDPEIQVSGGQRDWDPSMWTTAG